MAQRFGRTASKLVRHISSQQTQALDSVWSRRFAVSSADIAVQSSASNIHLKGSSNLPVKLGTAAGGLILLGYAYQYSPPVAHAESIVQDAAPGESPEVTTPADDELAKYQRCEQRRGMPNEVILYQYEVCPFCNKVRAFLDYHKVPYRTVEVNPLTKKQLKWSGQKKVPVALLDNELVNDSSLILSRLAVELEEPEEINKKSWFGNSAPKEPISREVLNEEIKWRRWVDKRFVQIITVNIYRSLRESWQTFDYITEHGNFNFAERQAARVAGSGLMWGISGKLIKKYGIEGDLRTALYAAADEWVAAIGPGKTFLGGGKPNLADLSMFGVIRSITGTDTFMDLMHNSKISGWYECMMSAVGASSKIAS